MNMEITWLDFQPPTDNQNGRHLATNFFFRLIFFHNSLETWFSGSASLLALSVFACNRKRGYDGHLYFLITKFLVNAITGKIIIGSLQFFMWCCPWVWRWPDSIFSFQPIIKMAATWPLIFFFPFFLISLETWYTIGFRGLRIYWHLSVFVCDWKRSYGGHLDFLI